MRAEPTEQGDAAARDATGGAGPSGSNVEHKKIFLRILRKVMNIPSESPLLATWREGRVVQETGRAYPPGWYGIQVMDEKEVDAIIVRTMPDLDPQLVAVQHWSVTLAQVLRTSVAEVKQYIILKNNRYRLNEAILSASTLQHIGQEQQRLAAMTEQAVHDQGLRKQSPSPSGNEPSLLVAQGSFGDLLPAMNDDMEDIGRLSPPASSALDSAQQQPSHTLQQGLEQPAEASGSGVPTWGSGAPAMGARPGGMAGVSREALLEKIGDTLLSINQAGSQLDFLGLRATTLSVQGVLQQFGVAVRPPNHPGDANAAPAPPHPPGR